MKLHQSEMVVRSNFQGCNKQFDSSCTYRAKNKNKPNDACCKKGLFLSFHPHQGDPCENITTTQSFAFVFWATGESRRLDGDRDERTVRPKDLHLPRSHHPTNPFVVSFQGFAPPSTTPRPPSFVDGQEHGTVVSSTAPHPQYIKRANPHPHLHLHPQQRTNDITTTKQR